MFELLNLWEGFKEVVKFIDNNRVRLDGLIGNHYLYETKNIVMENTEKLQLFEDRKVRTVWNEAEEQWYFSVKDVVSVLTDTVNAKDYISKMKRRDPELSEGWGQIVHPLSIQTAGGIQKENCATMEGIFRIIQSIPSKKAEPFKQWMAQVAAQRIDQAIDPERSIDQAVADYRRLGYSEAWITRRIKAIEIRKGLTKENLRDNMTNMELLLNALAEESATQLSKERNPEGLVQNAVVAEEGAEVAKTAREDFEKRLGRSVVTSEKAIDYIQSPEELPFDKR